MTNLKINSFNSISIAGIDPVDAPDYVDAYADAATIGGREATDEELDVLSDMLQEDNEILSEIIRDQNMRYVEAFI